MDSLYLSASSNTETVHIFKLETQKEKYVYVAVCLWMACFVATYQAAASSNENMHLTFCTCSLRPAEEPTTWGGYLGKVLMASTTYLPSQVTEMFTQGRAFATVRLPFCGHKNICALAVWVHTFHTRSEHKCNTAFETLWNCYFLSRQRKGGGKMWSSVDWIYNHRSYKISSTFYLRCTLIVGSFKILTDFNLWSPLTYFFFFFNLKL